MHVHRFFSVVVFVISAGSPLSAQSGGGPTGVVRKDPVLDADRPSFKPGAPLSVRALVTTPPPIKGILSWSLEARRHRGRFAVADVSPDGKWIATGGLDGTIRIWDLVSGKLERALIGHDSYVYGLAFSPEGRYLASGGSHDGTARIWEVQTGKPVRVLTGHPSYVAQVLWSPNGKWLVGAGGFSGDVSVWDVASGQKRAKAALGRYISSLSVHAGSNRLALISKDSLIAMIDLTNGKSLGNLGEGENMYSWIEWSPDGKRMAAAAAKATFVYDLESSNVVAKLDGAASRLAWNTDGTKLAVASPTDATLRIWNPTEGAAVQKIQAFPTWFQFMPGNSKLAVGDTVAVGVLELADGKQTIRHDITGVSPPYWASNRPVVTGVGTLSLALWDSISGKPLRTMDGHKAAIAAFAWSPDGKSVATASHDGTVRVWNTSTATLVHTLSKHKGAVTSVVWSPDGKEIASGGPDKAVNIWDAKTGSLSQTLGPHRDAVTALAWSPGGGTLAVGVNDGQVFPYPRASWKQPSPLAAKQLTTLSALAFTTDGKALAAGDHNGVGLVWSLPKGIPIVELGKTGSPPSITSIVFYPKGDFMAAGRGNHTLDLLFLKAMKTLLTLPTMAPVQHVSWNSAGPHLAVSSADRTCRFFDPYSGKLKGMLLAETDHIIALTAEGHYRAAGPAADHLVYVAQTEKGMETLTPAAFASRHAWKNNPALPRFSGK